MIKEMLKENERMIRLIIKEVKKEKKHDKEKKI